MASGSSSSSRVAVLAVAAALVIGAVAWLALRATDDQKAARPAPAESPAEAAPAPAAPSPAPTAAPAPEAPMVDQSLPDEALTEYGTPPAVAVEPVDGELPAPTAPSGDAPPIPEEMPQTPEWKLQKSQALRGRLEEREERLGRELAEAERAGADRKAERLRVVLSRVKRQRERLNGEITSLREEIGAASEPAAP